MSYLLENFTYEQLKNHKKLVASLRWPNSEDNNDSIYERWFGQGIWGLSDSQGSFKTLYAKCDMENVILRLILIYKC